MELLLLIAGLLLLDLLAMCFGVDSRKLEMTDRVTRHEVQQLTSRDGFGQPIRLRARRSPLRVRLARGLRALAVFIAPGEVVPQGAARH